MQQTKTPTFRPTVWPVDLPLTARVVPLRLTAAEGGGLDVAEPLPARDLPPDFVLQELLDLEPVTDQDVIDMTATWGLASSEGAQSFEYLAQRAPVGVADDLDLWSQTRPRAVHPEAVRLHLSVLRAMARHLLAYKEKRGPAGRLSAWEDEGLPVLSAAQADLWWQQHLSVGLRVFSPYVLAYPGAPLIRPMPTLYNVCCLQLARYVADSGLTVQRCANERCGQPFTVQRGRAREDYGQHRSRGVRYCSHLCAKAQAERERRRRRTEEAS